MKTKVTMWGNSYAVRIPKQLVEELQLTGESELLLEAKDNGFLLTKPTKKKQLAEILKNMQPQKEVDWGAACGKEAW
ncbi:MAG TPA: AbrB/MazE/SpoVT family DNA-binding domain-containing protein [Candidatus Nanoarchaeia archaeon]|nr:AbrB/MazE/SpoVT family DNA-binding domain-containing protein [Candidatus Nanoarchaeia archaeon]